MASPDDVDGVADLVDRGVVDPAHVVAIIAQTEGDGYARGYSALALQLLFAERLGITRDEVFDRIPMLMIGGTAGLMSPHYTLFENKPASGPGNGTRRLALGVSSTRTLLPEEYGTEIQLRLVADGVRAAMKSAGLKTEDDVVCVEMKCPQMTAKRMADAAARGKAVVDPNPMIASAMGRGAAALGAALALGEISDSDVSDDIIGTKERAICMTPCPTWRTVDTTPRRVDRIRTMFDLGLSVTVNTDDPGIFESGTMGTMLAPVAAAGKFTDAEMAKLMINAFKGSWLPKERREAYIDRLNEYTKQKARAA